MLRAHRLQVKTAGDTNARANKHQHRTNNKKPGALVGGALREEQDRTHQKDDANQNVIQNRQGFVAVANCQLVVADGEREVVRFFQS